MKPERSLLVYWSLFVYKYAGPLIIFGLLLIVVGGLYGLGVFNRLQTNGKDFQDPASGSSKVLDITESKFENSGDQIIVLFSNPNASVLSPQIAPVIVSELNSIAKVPHVQQVASYFSTNNAHFLSSDRHHMFATVTVDPQYQNTAYTTLDSVTSNLHGPVEVRLGGSVAANIQINDQVKRDLKKAETLSFPVLAILLLLFFGSVIAALTPLALGGLSIFAALFVMRLLAGLTPISSYAINIVTLLGLGLAIDYSLFMVARFREELAKYNDVEVAIAITVERSGRTIIFSGVTVAISLLSLLVFPQSLLRSLGLGGAAVVLTTVFLTLTLLPAALRLFGNHVNSLPVLRRRNVLGKNDSHRFWYKFSNIVMDNAAFIFIITAVVLLGIASNFHSVIFSSPGLSDAPRNLASRQVNDILTNNFHENTEPTTVLLKQASPAVDGKELKALANFSNMVKNIPGVTSVDSLSNYLPVSRAGDIGKYKISSTTLAQYSSGGYSKIIVYQKYPSQSAAARQLIHDIKSIPIPPDDSVFVGGASAQLVDLLHSLVVHLPYALLIIFSATCILIFLLTGSVVLPVKAIVLDLLSLITALGIITWVFQSDTAGIFPLGVTGSINAIAAILVFTVAFGLSADYEFFLLSRIKEEYDKTNDNTHSVAFGIQQTAGIITAAAILFVAVIGMFMTSKIPTLQQIGMGLAAAVIIDATLVRLLLVPSAMRLLGRTNWWTPRPLTNFYKKFGINH